MNVTRISRDPKRRRQRMDIGVRRLITSAVLLVCLIAVIVLIVVFWPIRQQHLADQAAGVNSSAVTSDPDNATFVIHSITVEGNSHLSADTIIAASGLEVGQSIWSVSKTAAINRILSLCPYVATASITCPSFDRYVIHVEETTAVAAMYDDGHWVIVSAIGTALGYQELDSDIPGRYLYIKGATSSGGALGEPAMNERCESIVLQLLAEFEAQEITGINTIDLTDLTSITLEWNHQIEIDLGNDTNLSYEITVLKKTLAKILENRGEQATGRLDLSSYSNSELSNQVVFTPSELLHTSTTITTDSTTADNGTESTDDDDSTSATDTSDEPIDDGSISEN